MKIEILTQDNVTLCGELLQCENPKATVLINPGTAAKTGFYKPFATFIRDHGFNVFLWNYRGFCESRFDSLKGSPFTFSDVGFKDIPAVIAEMKSRFANLPITCVGHSAGAQQIGFAANCHELNGLIAVGTSCGHLPHMPWSYRIKGQFFFYAFAPVTAALCGYIPAKRFRFMEDLPRNVVSEWRAWCQEPHYFFSPKFFGPDGPHGAYKNFKFPIHVISADDEEISTEKNIENFWKHVQSEGGIQFKRYSAKDLPSKKVGHFGYFKKTNKVIWQDILAILKQMNSSYKEML